MSMSLKSRKAEYNKILDRDFRNKNPDKVPPNVADIASRSVANWRHGALKSLHSNIEDVVHERVREYCHTRNISMDTFTEKALIFFLNHLENK